MSGVLKFSDRITCLPIVHGSGDFALAVRAYLLTQPCDCVAVPLPTSFQADVERAIAFLPTPTLVLQREPRRFEATWQSEWDETDEGDDDGDDARASYVPIDPCQGVIMALRIALGEHIPRAFIDLETAQFEAHSAVLPDAYALKQVSHEKFAAALLPAIARVPAGQPTARVRHMARELRRLERRHQSILFVCSMLDWPWIREAYTEGLEVEAEHEEVEPTTILQPQAQTLLFMLGELPFITALYERARAELEPDENLSLDGVKELLLAARDAYRAELKGRARKITPLYLRQCLKYIRNLTLLERRLTPDLYTLVLAAQQVAGDTFALHVAETARDYAPAGETPFPVAPLGIDKIRMPEGETLELVSRLPGPPLVWRSLNLVRRPEKKDVQKWQTQWNPYTHCSWPPEDQLIESFRAHVFERARQIMGQDLVRTEKFTTSVQDGIDIRETIRHWYEGDLYVKILPPARGALDCVIMLFDSPADPRDYPWRTTWYAEHDEESTLAFFATSYLTEMVGPGIGLSRYGGGLFLFPPIHIPDVWNDSEFDFCDTLEERLVAAGCKHSRERHVVLVSSLPPGALWRRLAKRFGKQLVHVPLAQFSASTIEQLRIMHVLNGKHVRSYAADFIRKA